MTTVIRGDDNFDTADNATQTELDSGLAGKIDTGSGGKVLQVVQTVHPSANSYNTRSWADIASLSATITPSSTSSKILVSGFVTWSGETINGWLETHFRVTENGSPISVGTYGTNYVQGMGGSGLRHDGFARHGTSQSTFSELRSPATTSALTYTVQCSNSGVYGDEIFINRPYLPSNTYSDTGVSVITLMEVEG